MREKQTNLGKKEQRQINQLLNKGQKRGAEQEKLVEAHDIHKQHRIKHRRNEK
jgi:hypothetical protein